MVDRAGEQIGDGGEVDMRMRAHVDARARAASCAGPIWSKKMNGPDRRPLAMRQRAVDLEPAEIVGGGQEGLEEEIVGHSTPYRHSSES